MEQTNGSSYKAIIYLLTVFFCLFLIHISEVVTSHYHQEGINNIQTSEKQNRPKKKKPTQQTKKIKASVPDTLKQSVDEKIANVDSTNTLKQVKKDDKAFFTELYQNYMAQRTKSSPKQQARTDLVIRYYKKKKDGDRIYKLRELGFYIHERQAVDDFDGYASNAIFYGDSVSKDDLMIIAYHLKQNKVDLQSIKLSKFHDAWKAHSVEIGTDTTALDNAAFTLANLRKLGEDM
ncbi:MAG: hypothetical protein ABJF11_08740 [Reichenbachiella sp.]|uniref:hypothetical protein n=1 Tax=Reichenbachiella sp. TaxID=2184521 RepID=UPI00326574E9